MAKIRFAPFVVLMGLLLVSPGSMRIGLAHGLEPQGEVQPQGDASVAATVSNKYSYQGVLKENGQPVTGSRDMTFRLCSDDDCTTQLDSVHKASVQVTEGLFSVELKGDPYDFSGRGLWLEVEVGGTSLGCQEIMPVPYALSLRPGAMIDSATSAARLAFCAGSLGEGDYRCVGAYGEGDWGVHGKSSGGFGVRGESDGTAGTGVYGEGPEYGVQGEGGIGVYGSGQGVGVEGHTVYGTGVKGTTQDASGYGGYFENKATSGAAYGVRGESASRSGVGVYGLASSSSGGHGVYAKSSGDKSAGAALLAENTNTNKGIAVWAANESSDSTLVVGNDGSGPLIKGFGGDGGEHEFKVSNEGWVSIGTTSPARHALAVKSSEEAVGGTTVHVENDNPKGIGMMVETYSDDEPTLLLSQHGEGEILRADSWVGGWHRVFKVKNDGTVQCSILEITGGSDLSEPFDVRATEGETEPGMVVCIDPDHPGKLVVCSKAYDRTVAGIISGAGDVEPGMLMAQRDSVVDGAYPVALTGRVYAWAEGPVEPGDLLTTSDTPGHAAKVTDYGKAHGAIIGKAMTGLKEGQGLVLVLVALQ